jgi:hypothetical protein
VAALHVLPHTNAACNMMASKLLMLSKSCLAPIIELLLLTCSHLISACWPCLLILRMLCVLLLCVHRCRILH